MRHRAAAFGGAEVRGGGENGPISRRKSPSNGGPECRYDASLAAQHETQASLIQLEMIVSVLEAGFLWRVRVLQGPATRHEILTSVSSVVQVRSAIPWLFH